MTLPRSLDELDGHDAWLYVRESSKAQGKKYGPAAQRDRAQRLAAAYGIRIVRTFQDLRSGRNLSRREDFGRLLAELPGSGIRVVMVAYASRWARDEFDSFATLKALHDAAGCLVVADKALLSTDETRFTELSRELVEAAHYSRELKRNIRDGIEQKVLAHADQHGPLPFGFRRRGQRRVAWPDPRTIGTAARAYELAAAGRRDAEIAADLDLTLWTVRGILRSPLYAGRLRDGRATRFPAPVPLDVAEQAWANRRSRTTSGHQSGRHRVYPLTDRGPLVCDRCERPLKGATKFRRNGERVAVYRHPDKCDAWRYAEGPAERLERQVADLLAGAKPNGESEARIRAALVVPPSGPDRLALGRIDAQLRALGLEVADPERVRSTGEILEEIEHLQAERAQVARTPRREVEVHPDDALHWLSDLAGLWRDTSPAGRRALAVSIFARLGAVDQRIVDVDVTDMAERRGLVLALPARLGVTVVGDTGARPIAVTSWAVRIARRSEWLAAARRARSA